MQFSRIELRKLHIAWLAWNNIQTKYFLRNFKFVWNNIIEETSILFQKCNYNQNVCEVGKAGFTLSPDAGFAFDSMVEAYQINIWSLLFCLQEEESSIFFNPSSLIASDLVHEYSHFSFWKQHNVLGKDKQTKEEFDSNHGFENERYALTKERDFLKQLIEVVSPSIDIVFFRVNSWDSFGHPIAEGKRVEFLPQDNLRQRINNIENELKMNSSKQAYSKRMVESARNFHSKVSSILRLSLEERKYPIVTMEI